MREKSLDKGILHAWLMLLSEATDFKMKTMEPDMGYFPMSYWLVGFQTIQAIAIALEFSPEVDGQTLLLKTQHSVTPEYKDLIWNQSGNICPLTTYPKARKYIAVSQEEKIYEGLYYYNT